jgi:hypothetical protein
MAGSTGTHGALKKVQVKGRGYAVSGENAGNRTLGGRENEIAKNGDSTVRVLQKEVSWKLSDVELAADMAGHIHLQEIADIGEEVPIMWTMADNSILAGIGIPTGPIEFDQMTGLLKVTFEGSGKVEPV